jgi:hypothetical protein
MPWPWSIGVAATETWSGALGWDMTEPASWATRNMPSLHSARPHVLAPLSSLEDDDHISNAAS